MNEKTKVQVQGVPETMLQTLYARAQESKKPNHHICLLYTSPSPRDS